MKQSIKNKENRDNFIIFNFCPEFESAKDFLYSVDSIGIWYNRNREIAKKIARANMKYNLYEYCDKYSAIRQRIKFYLKIYKSMIKENTNIYRINSIKGKINYLSEKHYNITLIR